MRDPARIDRILTLLEAIWSYCPDLRLGQIIVNAVGDIDYDERLFYLEDQGLIEKFEQYLNLLEQRKQRR